MTKSQNQSADKGNNTTTRIFTSDTNQQLSTQEETVIDRHVYFGLVSFFNGISTFLGYLIRELSLWKNSLTDK